VGLFKINGSKILDESDLSSETEFYSKQLSVSREVSETYLYAYYTPDATPLDFQIKLEVQEPIPIDSINSGNAVWFTVAAIDGLGSDSVLNTYGVIDTNGTSSVIAMRYKLPAMITGAYRVRVSFIGAASGELVLVAKGVEL